MEWKFATTLIGSQPYTNPVEAVSKTIDGRVSCPSWPQMPAKGLEERMFYQTGVYLPGLKVSDDKIIVDLDSYDPTDIYTAILNDDVDYFVHPPNVYEGLYQFLENDVSSFTAVKGQVTGPISEGLQIADSRARPVIYDESYSEIVRKTVNMMAKWQARRLSMCNSTVIMFYDEPSMSVLGTPFASISDEQAIQWINEVLEGVDAFRGVHCCGNTNWEMLLSTNIEIMSFDAYLYGDNILMYPDALNKFYAKGGSLAWGIVPNADDSIVVETVDSLVSKLEALFDKLEEKGINRQKAAAHSLITPQCGLGGTSIENVDKVFDLLAGVSAEMRSRYGFE